jgi:hypothetical protein
MHVVMDGYAEGRQSILVPDVVMYVGDAEGHRNILVSDEPEGTVVHPCLEAGIAPRYVADHKTVGYKTLAEADYEVGKTETVTLAVVLLDTSMPGRPAYRDMGDVASSFP